MHNGDNNDDATRKQNRIGTRKCDSEASTKTNHNMTTMDLGGSTTGVFAGNTQRTTRSEDGDDEVNEGQDNDHNRPRGEGGVANKPRSYRDVVVKGKCYT